MDNKEQLVVFDVLGPCYHYDERGWINSAVEPGVELLKKQGYSPKTPVEESRDEEDMIMSGKETPLIMPGFVETVLFAKERGQIPIVVSAGTPRVLEYAVERAARDYQERKKVSVTPEKLFDCANLVSTVGLGSKKEPQTWRKAVSHYEGAETIAVFEDSFSNLVAAMSGLDARLGYHITSTKNGLSALVQAPRILRGHMLEAYMDLRQNLANSGRNMGEMIK